MTYSYHNVRAVRHLHKTGDVPLPPFLPNYASWPGWLQVTYNYLIGCHVGHLLDFSVALLCYYIFFVWTNTFEQASTWQLGWVSRVVAFNLVCEFTIYGFWHWFVYASEYARGPLKSKKFNKNNQYEENGPVGMFSSTSGHLQREVFLTTLGWLQSSAYQCVMMWLWASGRVPFYADFWATPSKSIALLMFVTYFREFHFYWCHRMMHPWWNRKNGLAQGDIGAVLYRYVHSLHHKSYNPGPWSGLAMHPVEHFLYYTCTLLPLIIPSHPMHFLYPKFHADIAPIGGHDGYGEPGGNGDFHWLHHAKFECNYGVPLINFDRLFGTWQDCPPNPAVQQTTTTTTAATPAATKTEHKKKK